MRRLVSRVSRFVAEAPKDMARPSIDEIGNDDQEREPDREEEERKSGRGGIAALDPDVSEDCQAGQDDGCDDRSDIAEAAVPVEESKDS